MSKKRRRDPVEGCLPYRRNQVEGRVSCMLPPQLGAEDFRLLVMGSGYWKDWDAMQFHFDELNEKLLEKHPGKRIVLVHTAQGATCRMASLMTKVRYGWRSEVHQTSWAAREARFAVRHMVKLGVNHCVVFQDHGYDDPHSRIAVTMAKGRQIPYDVVHPMHDLERLARKAFIDPPKLGEK